MKCFVALVSLCLINSVWTNEVDVDSDCANDEKCVDRQLTGIIDRFDQEERVPLFGGLEIVKTLEEEPDTLQKVDDGFVDRIRRYVETHEISFRQPIESSGRSMEEYARSKRLKKLIIPLLLALKLKLIIVLPIILSGLALIAIKGVFAGLFALLLSGFTALKSLTESKQDQVTAILATPLQSLHHHDFRWGRQDVVSEAPQQVPIEAYNLPYAAYQNLAQGIPQNIPQSLPLNRQR